MIKVSTEFVDKKKFNDFIRYIKTAPFVEVEANVQTIAENTAQAMKNKITNSKKRHSFGSNLEDNIETEVIVNDPGKELIVGIGNVAQLKGNAPYFEVLNNGGYVPYSTVKGAPLGSFEGDKPSGSASPVQNWERSGDKGYFMKPTKPIEGIAYIEDGVRELNKGIIDMLKRFRANFLKGAK